MAKTRYRTESFVHRHSLSIASVSILIVWIVCTVSPVPAPILGHSLANAIADWSGVVVMIFATKYLYERDRLRADVHRGTA